MEKHKSLWTKKEESELSHEMRLNRPLEEIAKKHQRSQKAIELRFALILQRALAEGEKMFTLQKEYRITEQAIKRYLDMLQETKTAEPTPMDYKKIESSLEVVEEKLKNMEKLLAKIYKKLK